MRKRQASVSRRRPPPPRPAPGARFSGGLLDWYDAHRRALPWRARKGERPDPYRVWLSEIMLQQTTVRAVVPYFNAFLERWPDVHTLAAAGLDDVLHAWQGLGYYARARNLHRCAQAVSETLAGRFPATPAELEKLPGIGPYTAAAVAAIAFDRPATVVDGNVERVIARYFGVTEPLPRARGRIRRLAAKLAPGFRPGDYAQALMDLGAMVCTPRKPACGRCPLSADCVAFNDGLAEELPRRAPKPDKPTRRGFAFWAVRRDGAVLLRRREAKGLLGGMMELPCEWREDPVKLADALARAPLPAGWRALPGTVRHSFTHFHLEICVLAARVAERDAARLASD
ncbi:MAG: A/G-specific adenine glycosylase, partial [Alphaproteobacteria bacterium]